MLNRKTAVLAAAAVILALCGAAAFADDQVQEGGTPDQSQSLQAGDQSQQTDGQTSQEEQEDTAQGEAGEQAEPSGEETGEEEEQPAQEETSPDPEGTLSFGNLAGRMREHELNILSLEETIASMEVIDYDKMQEDLRKQLNSIANIQWALILQGQSMAADSLQQSYDALRDAFDDLKDGVLQEDNAAVVRQLENAQDQVVMAGESLYVALTELELNRQTAQRSLEALERTIEEMELRYELGQISALTLEQTKAGKASIQSTLDTLDMNITNYKLQLELMVGEEPQGTVRLQELPQVTQQQVEALDLEKDLEAAKEISYQLFAAQRTLDDAKEAYQDAGKDYHYNENNYNYLSAQHTWQAAQYTYDATVQAFENSFRTLYLQVKDCWQVLQAAQTALACEKDSYAADQLKYEQGTLSRNKLLEAEDELSAAQDKVDGAMIDLFTAYHNYRWAADCGILN